MQCPTCAIENPSSAKYCIECGTPLFKKCDVCGTSTVLGAKFCPNCGKQFEAVDINVIKYKNKLTFYDYIFHQESKSGKYLAVSEKDGYKLLDIKTLKPIFDYTFDEIGEQKDYFDFCFLKRNGKWGIVNPITKKQIVGFIYDNYKKNDHSGPEFRVCQNGLWGKVDATSGKITVPIVYDCIEFDDRVKQNGYWGWLNNHGNNIPCEYISLSSYVYSGNIRPSQHKNGKWGVIDRGGRIVIEFDYDEIVYKEPFGHSLYYLRKGPYWGLYCEGKRYPCNYTLEEVQKLKWY